MLELFYSDLNWRVLLESGFISQRNRSQTRSLQGKIDSGFGWKFGYSAIKSVKLQRKLIMICITMTYSVMTKPALGWSRGRMKYNRHVDPLKRSHMFYFTRIQSWTLLIISTSMTIVSKDLLMITPHGWRIESFQVSDFSTAIKLSYFWLMLVLWGHICADFQRSSSYTLHSAVLSGPPRLVWLFSPTSPVLAD